MQRRRSSTSVRKRTSSLAPSKTKATAPADKNVSLERILGNTVENNNAWSINPATEEIAYTAGNVVVIYNPDTHKQVRFLRHTKTVSAVQYSPDGRFLAIGEKGKNAAVHLWKVGNTSTTRKPFPVARLTTTFPFGILSCVFSDGGGYVFATSEREDMGCVWEVSPYLRRRMDTAPADVAPLVCQPTKNKILSCTYFAQHKVFITAGSAHLKAWSLERPSAPVENRRFSRTARLSDVGESKESRGPVTVSVSSASLGTSYRTATFVQVASWDDKCYVITSDGHLCRLAMTVQNGRTRLTMEKAKNLKTASVHALSVNARYVVVGCAEGVVRVLDRETLEYLGTTPKPNALGQECSRSSAPSSDSVVYPDVLACLLTPSSQHLYTLYSDGGMTSWNMSTFPQVQANFTEYAHKQCVWDMHLLPSTSVRGESLITCSADNTIRLWNVASESNSAPFLGASLDGIIHTDPDYQCLRQGAATTPLGIRCMAISPDGQHLASGDRQGNIRIHELSSLAQIDFKEAHESEVLSLSYTPAHAPISLLASASRDRLIHLFATSSQGEEAYPHVDALDDHTAAITAVHLATTPENELRLISCSADKSVIFRSLHTHEGDDERNVEIRRFANAVTAGAPYDLCGDAASQSIYVGGKEKKISRFDLATGKAHGEPIAMIRDAENTNVIKLFMHESGKFVLASSTDKALRLYACDSPSSKASVGEKENVTSNRTARDLSPARCLFSAYGTAFITAACFSTDSSRVYAASADGTVFVWRLPAALVQKLTQSLPSLPSSPVVPTPTNPNESSPQPQAAPSVVAPSTWTTSEAEQDSLISRLGLKPQVKDEFNFQALFAKPEDAATQALRRLTIEPSKEGDAPITDATALSVALSSVSDDEKFFDFDHFAEISLSPADHSRLSLSRAFRSSSPSTDSKLSHSAKKTKSARLRHRLATPSAEESAPSTPMQAHPPVTRATSIPMPSEEPSEEASDSLPEEDETVLMELSGDSGSTPEEEDHATNEQEDTSLPVPAPEASQKPSSQPSSPAVVPTSPDHDSSCDEQEHDHVSSSPQAQTEEEEPEDAPSEEEKMNTEEEESAPGTPVAEEEEVEVQEGENEQDTESYDLVLRHQAAMNLLQNACENALQLYDDAHYEYDLVSQENTESAFLPVYEQILDDYEQVFHRVGERLGKMPHSHPTASSAHSLHQFSGMLRQLASMIEEKRIVS